MNTLYNVDETGLQLRILVIRSCWLYKAVKDSEFYTIFMFYLSKRTLDVTGVNALILW
jgi:hypothetical protein